MGQSFGTVSNVFYAVLLGTVLLNVLYMAAGSLPMTTRLHKALHVVLYKFVGFTAFCVPTRLFTPWGDSDGQVERRQHWPKRPL